MHRFVAVGLALGVVLVGVFPAASETEEGINVHGHWKIEVLKPDRTSVSVTEVDNALVIPDGQQFLALSLATFGTIGSYRIVLENGSGAGPCDDGSGGDTQCLLTEAGSNWMGMGAPHSTNLVIGTASTVMTIESSVTADHADTVAKVSLQTKVCTPGTSADACLGAVASYPLIPFTQTTLSSPVPVDAGQIIQVTVTISFS